MSDFRHKDGLLMDVLGEGVSPDHRVGLLNQTLRLARRRRHFRQARGVVSALAVLAVLGLLLRPVSPPDGGPSGLPAKPYQLVRTQPLPRTAWVDTKPFLAAGLVASVATRQVVVTASAGSLVHEINDDELLALVPKPAALVRHGPHAAELVFVNPEDQEELLRN